MLAESREQLIAELDRRLEDKIIEKSNVDLLKKLINNAEDLNEAINIASLGTTYKRTGFHFDKRLEEKKGKTIKYFKKNSDLSFFDGKGGIVHKLIIGDNYDALLNLLIEYRGKIDVIYIDPPYGKDSMGEFAKTNYNNAITRDNLLSMLYTRLILAKQLLSNDGVIFCSIDDKNQAYVKCLMDEIFEESNFVANIVWDKKSSAKGVPPKNMIVNVHEYILVYQKKDGFKFIGEKRSEDDFKNPDNDIRGPWRESNIKSTTKSPDEAFTIVNPENGREYTNTWAFSKESLEKMIKEGRILWKDTLPKQKEFLYEMTNENKAIKDSWGVFDAQSTTVFLKKLLPDIRFDNPKPINIMKYLLRVSTKPNSIILDFFAGSGTTAQAVMELNAEDKENGKRNFILVQMNEITKSTPNGIVIDVLSKRLKRLMTGRCYDNTINFELENCYEPYGGSLDVYEICEVSNFENTTGKTAFDVIDETLYGKNKFETLKEKIEWVCNNFEGTQKYLTEHNSMEVK